MKNLIVNAFIGTTLGFAPLALQADSSEFGESSVKLLVPFTVEPLKPLHFGEILIKPGQHTEARVDHDHQGTHHFDTGHEIVPNTTAAHFHVKGPIHSQVEVSIKSQFTVTGKRTGHPLQGKITVIKVLDNKHETVVNGGLLPAFRTIPATIRDSKGAPIMLGGSLAITAGTPDDDYEGDYQFLVINK